MYALYRHYEDGKQWLRLVDNLGNEFDEPISGWTEVINLLDGTTQFRHTDGRELKEKRVKK
jgi:hypothetical protein